MKILIVALLLMTSVATADDRMTMAITCAAMTEALEHPSAGWWRRLITQSVGSSEKARQMIDDLAGVITQNILDGNVGKEEVDTAMAECHAAYRRGQ